MTSQGHYSIGLDKNAANYVPLSPLSFLVRSASVYPNHTSAVYEGRANGTLTWPPRGTMGFGYDPVFVPLGDTRTFAEHDPEEKHAISHRADAFAKLVKDQFGG